MSFFNYLEKDYFSLPHENEFLSESIEMESSTGSISNNMKDNFHDEWLLIGNLVDILGQFDTITTTLSSSKFVTLSLIYHLIDFLKKNLSNILNAINDNDDNNNDDNNNNNDEIVLPLFEQDVQLFEKIMVLFLIITLFFIN